MDAALAVPTRGGLKQGGLKPALYVHRVAQGGLKPALYIGPYGASVSV
jgi:hypothetical protein